MPKNIRYDGDPSGRFQMYSFLFVERHFWFSFKTSGLFLMYDTFPRSRNEFKRETKKF
jgi:hypothetical protein